MVDSFGILLSEAAMSGTMEFYLYLYLYNLGTCYSALGYIHVFTYFE